MSSGLVLVAGVPLPAAEVAEALDRYALARLMDERRRPAGGRAFRSAPWAAAVGQLRAGASAENGAEGWGNTPLVGCAEYAVLVGRSPSTVRGWAAAGALEGARRAGRDWLIPVDAPPPTRRRTP